ncbi:MAG: cysteine synthase [Lysobacteraceae bacterium]|nr:MAG: cysteine synthase [Xanthomonadaceae bacterium]
MNAWVSRAISLIESDFNRSADTHLIKVDLPATPGIDLYLKDESTHPTGSLKHRLARSLFLFGLCNGQIHENTVIVEASSGSTAISEAYFARLLGLRFVAVVPSGTSQEKIEQIGFYGGECHFVAGQDIYCAAADLAEQTGGHYMDQFTFAERVTDWRGNNNIADSIFTQMQTERFPAPKWVVVSAGTGGTSATIGRYIRYRRLATQLCVADPEHSVFHEYYVSGDRSLTTHQASTIEGIGRPRVEPSFVASVVDNMIKVSDEASLATIHFLQRLLHRRCGGSTGTNLYAAFELIAQMHAAGDVGSVVSMICDDGERYAHSYYDDEWLAANGFDLDLQMAHLEEFYKDGAWSV